MKTKNIIVFLCLLLLPSVLGFVDFKVNRSDLILSNNNPFERENVTINATIHNLGNENANNVLVEFFDDVVIIGNSTINIPSSSSVSVIKFWKAEIGPNNITIKIDSKNTLLESNETNNNATTRISISAYHTYVGTARSFIALGFESSLLFTKETIGCNLLIADSDSNVDFSSLQAIGKKRKGGSSTVDFKKNDFMDIDTILGMAAFDDSLNELYGGREKEKKEKNLGEEETFFVFNTAIKDVPVINSTNSTLFRTGILWDISDDTQGPNGEYDVVDKEDLIFITKVSPLKQGKFGIYDYEIKIPALLRDYKPGSSTVDFFIDLDSFPCS